MEERLNAWLKTNRLEKLISPVDWETVPDECRIRLDNYARDEAVKRADSFAHEGLLDLRRQEAVRQLVDGMAQSWKLQGDGIRSIVEEFYDELPPKPGYEFEKLAVKLFRHQVNASASEVFNGFDPQLEHTVIKASAKYLDVPPNQTLDRSGFLHAYQNAYDTWTRKQAREAVDELLECIAQSGNAISLNDLLPVLELRGARTWATALKLEQDIGVDTASSEELVRMLKRYALMVKRGGPEVIGLTAQPPIEEASPDKELESETEDTAPEPVEEFIDIPSAVEPEEEIISEADKVDDEILDETENETEQDDRVNEAENEDERYLDSQTETEYEPPKLEIAEEIEVDSDEEPESELDESVNEDAEDVEEVEKEVEDIPSDEESVEPTFSMIHDEDVADETQPIFDSEEALGEPMVRDPNRFHVRDLDDLDDDDLEAIEYLFGDKAIQYDGDSEDDEAEDDEEEAPARAVGVVNGMQMRKAPSIRQLRDSQGDPLSPATRPHRDRFEMLRSGELRLNVVKGIYSNDETKFDIFLAKLSDAPDWKTGKTVIAKEMLERNVNLEEEPARELFFALKKCMAYVLD